MSVKIGACICGCFVAMGFCAILGTICLGRESATSRGVQTMPQDAKDVQIALVQARFHSMNVEIDDVDRLLKRGEFVDLHTQREYPFSVNELSDIGLDLIDGKQYIVIFVRAQGKYLNETHIRFLMPCGHLQDGGAGEKALVGGDLLELVATWGNPDIVEEGSRLNGGEVGQNRPYTAVMTFKRRQRVAFITKDGRVQKIQPMSGGAETKGDSTNDSK